MTNPEIKVETDDWKLGCFMDWQPKSHTEKCTGCGGKGKYGGGLGWMEEELAVCNECYGSGTITKGPRTPKPELPPVLLEYMRNCWWQFFNGPVPQPPKPNV